ncbi:unnamed protein product [Tilletia controversa]|uniref:Uncharacterized protein n=4 Tax=Tilletia TaxID=13289 RepID=A0A8X7STS5_9BASI|nr:hypothetical protein CF328_g7252 [Tilletia controversa]KAE8187270.1 hypothetical protein CF335_g7222 [Tilletia laevis]CAD6884242.1 unnamed protein product [Tilletia caries]KAE8199268.1 hypothetical protein CF336_g1283 [Tilletia laevis]KAE8240333.1 hypothetical protein A4X06_0g7813 [Tilletia controversa]
MLHILAPFILSDLGLAGLKLVLAAIQTGLTFTRLSTASSSGKPINQATAVVIPAIYGGCAIAQIVLCALLAGVHAVELKKGELGVAVWRLAKGLVWATVGLTALMVIAGVVTIATNYTGSDHWYTDGSKAFNTPFTITFIIFMALSVLHIFVLFLYRRRVLSQGPRAKGRIGNDYEQVGATLSNSLRRARRVEDSSSGGGEMAERLPLGGAADVATARSPSGYDSHHRGESSGLQRQYSSAGYADYDEEEEGEGYEEAAMYAHGGDPSRHSRYSSAGVQHPLTHAQHGGGDDGNDASYPSFPRPSHAAQLPAHGGHHSQQATYASAEPDHFIHSHPQQARFAEQEDTGLRPTVAQQEQPHRVAYQIPASVVPNYTGSTALPTYHEPGYTHNHTGSQADAGRIRHDQYSSYA